MGAWDHLRADRPDARDDQVTDICSRGADCIKQSTTEYPSQGVSHIGTATRGGAPSWRPALHVSYLPSNPGCPCQLACLLCPLLRLPPEAPHLNVLCKQLIQRPRCDNAASVEQDDPVGKLQHQTAVGGHEAG